MNANDHVGEMAALYALGALDDSERAAIDRHVSGCTQCAGAIVVAEEDVATIVTAGVRSELPPSLLHSPLAERRMRKPARSGWFAVAAALLIGLLPSAYFWNQDRAMHAAMASHAEALARLAQPSVRTSAFVPIQAGMTAHVMFPEDGSWYVVVVRGVTKALDVVWMHDGQRTMLGTTQSYGEVAMLYLPKSHRMDRLALLDGVRVVAQARLAY